MVFFNYDISIKQIYKRTDKVECDLKLGINGSLSTTEDLRGHTSVITRLYTIKTEYIHVMCEVGNLALNSEDSQATITNSI